MPEVTYCRRPVYLQGLQSFLLYKFVEKNEHTHDLTWHSTLRYIYFCWSGLPARWARHEEHPPKFATFPHGEVQPYAVFDDKIQNFKSEASSLLMSIYSFYCLPRHDEGYENFALTNVASRELPKQKSLHLRNPPFSVLLSRDNHGLISNNGRKVEQSQFPSKLCALALQQWFQSTRSTCASEIFLNEILSTASYFFKPMASTGTCKQIFEIRGFFLEMCKVCLQNKGCKTLLAGICSNHLAFSSCKSFCFLNNVLSLNAEHLYTQWIGKPR